jgi:hypothetical protein
VKLTVCFQRSYLALFEATQAAKGKLEDMGETWTYRRTFKLTECGVLSESPMDG